MPAAGGLPLSCAACQCRRGTCAVTNHCWATTPLLLCRICGARLSADTALYNRSKSKGPYCSACINSGKWRRAGACGGASAGSGRALLQPQCETLLLLDSAARCRCQA